MIVSLINLIKSFNKSYKLFISFLISCNQESDIFLQYSYFFHIIQQQMKSKISIKYIGEIDTYDNIKKLLKNYQENTNNSIETISEQISPILYEFQINDNNGISMVLRTHDQIITFLKVCNKIGKQLKSWRKITFQQIKNKKILMFLVQIKQIAQSEQFLDFFDIDHTIPNKKISIQIKKKSGGRYSQIECFLCKKWKICKAYILEDGLVTYSPSKNKILEFLTFGKDFSWKISDLVTQLKVHIYSYHRKLSLQSQSPHQFFIFIYSLDKYYRKYKYIHSQYRFDSFSPVRDRNQVQFYIDGAQYFYSVAQSIESAEQEVLICGWWVSPEFYLVRPCQQNEKFRLDNLLTRTAEKGVKIYVIVYFESKFLTIDSSYTLKKLQSLHTNIKVLRHPQIVLPTYWSHHEKIIIVDRCTAFLGGLDLCYGRYDDSKHLIDNSNPQMYPGIEYNNCRIADFINVRDHTVENVSRDQPRLPWHDVTLMTRGPCVKDLTTHFIQYWNHASYQTHFTKRYMLVSNQKKIIKKKVGFLNNLKQIASGIKSKIKENKKQIEQKNENQNKNTKSIQQLTHKQKQTETNNTPVTGKKLFIEDIFERKIFNKQKVQSPRQKIIIKMNQRTEEEGIFINLQGYNLPKTPTRKKLISPNLNLQIKQQYEQQAQFQMEQNKRIQQTQKTVKETISKIAEIELQESEQESIEQEIKQNYLNEVNFQRNLSNQENSSRYSIQIINTVKNKLFKKSASISYNQKIYENNQQNKDYIYKCQVLRSASQWSIGCKQSNHEKSIHDAYISLINLSEKFIYIENQFFISAWHSPGTVKNQIMDCIYQRIVRAISDKEQFKVVIFLPLVPGFAGELDDANASFPRVIMNWQYKTICKGQNSLIQRLKRHTEDPFQYIQFFSLRTHALINEKPVTQIIYLHTKLMIVDDKYLICGSANVNDRSMAGDRDSQICLYVESTPNITIKMNNFPYKVVDKIYQLRKKLWKEHFGLSSKKISDPICEQTWKEINSLAQTNTLIYRQIFGCYPDDQIQILDQIKKFKKNPSLEIYQIKSVQIKGNAVLFPLNFLRIQNLTSYHPNAIST